MSRLTVWIVIVFLTLTSISLSQKNDSDSTEIALSFLHAIQDPANSQKHIENATELLKKNKSEKINDTYNYWYIKYFILSSQLHQADSLAKIQIKKRDSSDLRSAKFYNLLGASKMMQQNYSETSKYLQKCIQIYEENNQLSKAAYVKSNLANLFFTLTDFDSAFKYAHEAFQVLNPEVDSIHYRTVMGILSISEAKIGKYEAAKKHANNTLKLGKTQKDMQSQALAYYALGTIYLGEKKYAKSVGYFNKCLTTAQRSNFANMEHLAHVELLNTYTKIGDFYNAKKHGEIALEGLHNQANKTTEYVIKKSLSLTYAGLKQFEKAYNLGHQADSIFRATSIRENKKNINELLIKYEAEKKDQALKLEQQENLTKEVQIRKQGWFLVTLGLLIISILLIFYIYTNTQKNKIKSLQLEQEKKMMQALVSGEEKERLRISNELHDGLASLLTGIKFQLEQQRQTPKSVLDALNKAHEETRRISHNLSPIKIESLGFIHTLKIFCEENSNSETKINFYSQQDTINYRSIREQILVYRICQEIIQNALKHSNAKLIEVQVIDHLDHLSISVEDDGKGFKIEDHGESFGILNLEKNIALLGGELTFESTISQGSSFFINFPK